MLNRDRSYFGKECSVLSSKSGAELERRVGACRSACRTFLVLAMVCHCINILGEDDNCSKSVISGMTLGSSIMFHGVLLFLIWD